MEVFAERRRRVLEAMNGVAIIPSAPTAIRNNDVEHEYRQDSDLFYLTGFDEPQSCLLLSTVHKEHRAVMFLRERDPEREIWDGARLGVERACEALSVDASYPIEELPQRLADYCRGADNMYFELGCDAELDAQLLSAIGSARGKGRSTRPWPRNIVHPEALIHERRLLKSPHEIDIMRKAAAITTEAHVEAMRRTAPDKFEYEIEAVFRDVFRRTGCERAAYQPIVGSGPNATILHYILNNRQMQDGELLLVDAGCEYEYYACDVTRTFPVNGKFSEPQRRVYQAVLNAQLAGIEEARPGASIESIHEVTLRHLVINMVDIGLLDGDVDTLIKDGGYRRFYMHRTSHWLGMDVHDVGAYFVDGNARPLEPGMVLTIEPGIYVSEKDELAPPEYRGIGVRIEDDILITEQGRDNLTAAVPKTVEAVEAACQSA